ncbi:hypothetical protein DRJ16_05060 [Candidatus Woesearchaeota archaeon]|nr:MAG: hypothetical protein DRJ16_05060 [Candidatus Woesearchaeota archaeon]
MATRNIVPVSDNEGNIGTSSKKWSKAWFHALHVAGNMDDGTNTVTIAQMKDLVDGHADLHEVGGSGEIDVRGLQGGWLTADTEANRPAAGTKDRYFYATDTGKLYYDNGSSWLEITPTPARHGNEAHNPDMLPLSTSSAIDAYMSGDKWLSVATSGIVGLPKQSMCLVYMDNGGASYSVSATTWTKVPFDTKRLDNANEFDTTNNRFTATEDGFYIFLVHLAILGVTDGESYLERIYKNGSGYTGSVNVVAAANTSHSIVGGFLIDLSAGDYAEVFVYGTTSFYVDNGWGTSLYVAKVA